MAMIQCPDCKKAISENAETCPKCGRKITPNDIAKWKEERERAKKNGKILGVGLCIIVIAFSLISAISGPPTGGAAGGHGKPNSFTTSQNNALRSAQNYLSAMPFSHDGLVNQLEYENYPHDDAVFAADNCGADWNEQALRSAKNYLSTSPFSYKGLIKQLEYEQYTTEQATYGSDNCGADWNEQAAKSAKNYLAIMAYSKDGLVNQLEFEGYTHEQALYGAKANGY